MRIYISGSITNNKNFCQDFEKAANMLKMKYKDCDIVNPAWLHKVYENGTHAEYMDICLTLLKMSEVVYMLHGWKESKGAKIELEYARLIGLVVIFEDKKDMCNE